MNANKNNEHDDRNENFFDGRERKGIGDIGNRKGNFYWSGRVNF